MYVDKQIKFKEKVTAKMRKNDGLWHVFEERGKSREKEWSLFPITEVIMHREGAASPPLPTSSHVFFDLFTLYSLFSPTPFKGDRRAAYYIL